MKRDRLGDALACRPADEDAVLPRPARPPVFPVLSFTNTPRYATICGSLRKENK